MSTTSATITSDTIAALESFGWTTPYNWKNVTNHRVDEYGNSVSIHDQGDTVRIEFEYALPGTVVETMNLSAALGGHRIARVIDALSAPVE